MELTLINFRCYKNVVITIPNSGMIRIKGCGGIGKSTILNGIYFALYGKCRKPFTHGGKTCRAELVYDRYGLSIVRSKQPSNRLLVKYKKKEYEDDAAQAIIDNILGMTHTEFYASSYFDQRKQSSILSMSPADQLSFIEAIAFGSDKFHEEKKAKTKEHVKSLYKEKDGLVSQINLLNSQIEACDKRIEQLTSTVTADEPLENAEIIKETISILSESIKDIKDTLKIKRAELKSIQTKENDNRKAEDELLKLETQIAAQKTLIANLGDVKTEEDINIMKANLRTLNETIQLMEQHLELENMKARYDEALEDYFIDIRKKMNEIIPKMMKDADSAVASLTSYEKLKPILDEEELLLKKHNESVKLGKEGILHIRDTIVADHDVNDENILSISLDKITSKTWPVLKKCILLLIETYKNLLADTNLSLDSIRFCGWYCPKCKTPLLEENSLLVTRKVKKLNKDEYTKEDIPNLSMIATSTQANISSLENIMENGDIYHRGITKAAPKVTKNTSGIKTMKDYQELSIRVEEHKKLMEENEKYQKIIDSKIPPQHLKKLQSQIKEKQKIIPKTQMGRALDLKSCQEEAKNLSASIEKAWHTKGNHSKYTRELKTLEKGLQNTNSRILKSYDTKIDSKTLSKEVSDLEEKLLAQHEELMSLNTNLSLLEDSSAIKYAMEEVKKLQEQKESLDQKLVELNDCIEGAEGLEKAAIEAQFLSLEKTIASINEHAKVYLANLFTLPIVAQFSIKTTTKQGKETVRPGIDIYVEYKGYVYDDIDEFSGSERQRCDLAFLFAVNDMLGSNIIMLDECFNNLDDDMAINTLEYIKDMVSPSSENRKNEKQVLIITHRVSDGLFDSVIDTGFNECAVKTALGHK